MVEIIGLATIVALSWLLAFSMATESDAEKRRLSRSDLTPVAGAESPGASKSKHAA
jgi:hypothetical protein